jgi:transglutaminase-like putative cysteine protease
MPTKQNRIILYLLVAINIIPHVLDVPQWVITIALAILAWKLLGERFELPKIHRLWVYALGFLCSVGVYIQYGVLWGDQASGALLVLLVAVKLLEIRGYRDIMVVTYLCFMILMTKLLADQSITTTIFMFVDMIALLALMISYHSATGAAGLRAILRRSAWIALMSTPFLVVFFFLFPRFQIGLLKPQQQTIGLVGYFEELKPGSVSQIIQSEEVAFRVSSEQPFPPLSKLYWRGAVLSETDGLNWKLNKADNRVTQQKPRDLSKLQRFDIMLEPNPSHRLFGLDWPMWDQFPDSASGSGILRSEAFTYETRLPMVSRVLYYSYSDFQIHDIPWSRDKADLNRYLDTHLINAPRARLWINELLRESKDEEKTIASIMGFYEKEFHYSLQPPPAAGLDEFLFETKVGFCEHFAGSMASLLRLAHIPARVVIGFHGGTSSVFQNYLTLRMLDAHAWLEYWSVKDQIWRRIDPTLVVAPQRIMLGAEQFDDSIFLQQGQLSSRYPFLSRLFGSNVGNVYFKSRQLIDQAESIWVNFLLRFNYEYQRDLLAKLGLASLTRFGFFIALFVVTLVGLAFLYFALGLRRDPMDRQQRAYEHLLRKLRKAGFVKGTTEGPLEFEKRVLREISSPELERLFAEWRELRYAQPQSDSRRLQRFTRGIRHLAAVRRKLTT